MHELCVLCGAWLQQPGHPLAPVHYNHAMSALRVGAVMYGYTRSVDRYPALRDLDAISRIDM